MQQQLKPTILLLLTLAKCDGGEASKLALDMVEEYCIKFDRFLVTDRASLANLLMPIKQTISVVNFKMYTYYLSLQRQVKMSKSH